MDFVASFVNQSRLPSAQPLDVLELHRLKRSPARPSHQGRLGKRLYEKITFPPIEVPEP